MDFSHSAVDVGRLFLVLAVILLAARVAGEMFERLGQPAVLGELLAGVVLGTSVLGIVPTNQATADGAILHVLAELGVVILLFEIGLETDLRALFRVGVPALTVAGVGVALPFLFGYLFWHWYAGGASLTAIFVGATLTATSVGITARVLADLGVIHTAEARIIIGAAVIDDILGLLILAVVEGLAATGTVSPGGVATVVALAVGFLALAMGLGLALAPRLFALVDRLRVRGALLAAALGFALLLAYAADRIGLAAIVGAFAAGLILSRTNQFDEIVGRIRPVADVLTPVFFVFVGAAVDVTILDPRSAGNRSILFLGGALFGIAVLGKLAAGFVARGHGLNRLGIGIGMVPRGEVGLIFAQLGLLAGILTQDVFSALLLMVMATTLVTPPSLQWAFARRPVA